MKRKNAIIIFSVIICLLLICIFLLYHALTATNQEQDGTDSAPDDIATNETSDEQDKSLSQETEVSEDENDAENSIEDLPDKDNREPLPAEITDNLSAIIMGYLCEGDFEEADDLLRSWQTEYKEPDDQAEDWMTVIDGYRQDITFALHSNLSVLDHWYFQNPEVLAASIVFSSMNNKYKAMIYRSSNLLPVPHVAVEIQEVTLDKDDAKQRLQTINSGLSADAQVNSLRVFEINIAGYECEFSTVRTQSGYFEPYSFFVTNEDYGFTYGDGEEIMDDNPDAVLDVLVISPLAFYPIEEAK